MKYHATLRLNKTESCANRCYSDDVIERMINNIYDTDGYNITKIVDSAECVILHIEVDTDELIEGCLNTMQLYDSLENMSSM